MVELDKVLVGTLYMKSNPDGELDFTVLLGDKVHPVISLDKLASLFKIDIASTAPEGFVAIGFLLSEEVIK